MRSIVTDYTDICAICGTYRTLQTHHIVYGTGLRPLADSDGLTIPVCQSCHDEIHNRNGVAGHLSKMLGQACWERAYIEDNLSDLKEARKMFITRYGRSWL